MGNPKSRRLRSLSCYLLAIAILQFGFVGFAPTATASSFSHDKQLITFRMVSATTGWALSSNQVLFTTNGGRKWLNRTPKKLRGVQFQFVGSPSDLTNGFDVLDSRSVLLAVPQSGNVSIFSTSNYGTTWSESTVKVEGGTKDSSKVTPLIIALVSEGVHANWLLMSNGGEGAGFENAELYLSKNGFATWRMISDTALASGLPGGGIKTGLAFSNSNRGWLTGYRVSENGAWLYTTSDGGAKWRSVSLARPVGYSSTGQYPLTFAPTFFKGVGLLPVLWPKEHAMVIYVTHDGGSRWVPSEPFSTSGGNPLRALSWVNASVGFAVTTLAICETLTGGTSWNCDREPATVRGLTQIQCISINHGWALVHGGLFETFKGAKNWSRIY
jgi:hypothetical protein